MDIFLIDENLGKIINSIFQVAKRIFDPFYENLDFGDWALQNGADDPELAAIIEDYFP